MGFQAQRARSCRSLTKTFAAEVRAVAARDVAKALEGYAVVVDWQHKEDVQRQMRRGIKERLRTIGMDPARLRL